MPQRSAGILLYRARPAGAEVLLVHPGGPFWAKKDVAGWSIPKGQIEPGETAAEAARREFAEETGYRPEGELMALGEFAQPSGKLIAAFALEGEFDAATLVSNTIEIEWPARSGRMLSVPEVDRAGWFTIETARDKLHRGQQPILAAFATYLQRSR